MNFIDHTGHIFSIDDYHSYPVGYEYDECPYTFWLQDEYSSDLSIDCFYIKPIRLILEGNVQLVDIKIDKNSNFKLLSPIKIQKLIDENKNPLDGIKLNYITDSANAYIKENNIADAEYNDFSDELSYNNININNASAELLAIPNLHCNYYYYTDKADNNKKIQIEDESAIVCTSDNDRESFQNYELESKLFIVHNEDPAWNFSSDDIPDVQKNMELNSRLIELGYTNSYNINIDGKVYPVTREQTNYTMIPFYVLGTSKEIGTWSTNILIHAKNDGEERWCPITVGGTFVDEVEELTINAKNVGLTLPKDICKAIYAMPFMNDAPDMSLWNQKVKEYLMNFMKLKGERGNFQSCIAALKWFGYGDRVKLYSLIQTDNEFIEQYILNNFDIQYDVIAEYRHFRNSTLLSLEIPGVVEDTDKDAHMMDFGADFWGEGKPYTKDLFEETVVERYDECDIEFVRPMYDWTFNDLALKLCALKYYYQKYFLPIHLYVHRASVTHQCFTPDVKLLGTTRTMITEKNIWAGTSNTTIEFPLISKVWLTDQCRLVDENWIEDPQLQRALIEHGLIDTINIPFYEIVDNCFTVQIKLVNKNYTSHKECIFNCKMFAYQDDTLMKQSDFSICSDQEKYILNFIIYPKVLNPDYDINFWLHRDYTIKIMCNGQWYTYKFNIAVPELDIEIGKLVYKYDSDVCRQFSGFDNNKPIFNIHMYLPELVTINNIDFIGELCDYAANENVYYIKNEVFEEEICSNRIYYWYYNEEGKKEILSSGKHTLVYDNNTNNYIIKDNKYSDVGLRIPKINEGPIFSSVYKNINSFINLYNIQANVPTNYNFLNKVHIFKLLKNEGGRYDQMEYKQHGNVIERPEQYRKDMEEDKYYMLSTIDELGNITYDKYRFGDNDSEYVKTLYQQFFTNDGHWRTDNLQYWYDNRKVWKQTTVEQEYFDLYIMHDYHYWYAIMISKIPIGQATADLSSIQKIYQVGNNYLLEYLRSDNKFLVNRMEFGHMNNVYHFNPKDMIVARLNNFDTLSFKLKVGSRWEFYPLGVGSTTKQSFESPTNIGLMSIGDNELQHANGYYSVKVCYSIDNFTNDVQERRTRILISDTVESPTPIIYDNN